MVSEEFNKNLKKKLFNLVMDNYGDRCPDHDESCAVCQAWDNFDTMVSVLDSTNPVYEHKYEILKTIDMTTLDKLSEEGWNVCGASILRKAGKASETLFYLRKRIT